MLQALLLQQLSWLACAQVHKIAVLDLRLVNLDRNGSNILASRTAAGWRLTPIDHSASRLPRCSPLPWQLCTSTEPAACQDGRLLQRPRALALQPGRTIMLTLPACTGYCLPSAWNDVTLDWVYWPQSSVPFDARTRAYIAGLDAEADLALLEANGLRLRPACQRIFKVRRTANHAAAHASARPLVTACLAGAVACADTAARACCAPAAVALGLLTGAMQAATLLLKEGSARRLPPRALGSIMSRERLGEPWHWVLLLAAAACTACHLVYQPAGAVALLLPAGWLRSSACTSSDAGAKCR